MTAGAGYKRNIDKVLLIYPPVRCLGETLFTTPPPLGVAYLAAVLRNECDVAIIDATIEGLDQSTPHTKQFILYGLGIDEIVRRVEEFKPDLVGMTCLFSSHILVIKELIEKIKKLDSGILTAIGGTYPTFLYEKCMEDQNLDFICLGEGENTARELVRGLRAGDVENIDGLVMRDSNCNIKANPRQYYIDPLDDLPFPAWDLMSMNEYKEKTVPHSVTFKSKHIFTMLTSRGCPDKCIFCSSTNFWGPKYRARSPENVLDEIEILVNKWGIEEIQFEDDSITLNRKRAKAIFQGIIDRGYKIHLNFPNGLALWSLDDELVEFMARAGAYEATLAVESGCQKVLDTIVKKPLNLQKALEVRSYFKKHRIRTNAFYIVGFPGETKDQIRETFRYARKLDTESAYFFAANPLPGTELYRIVAEKGYLEAGFEFTDITYSRSAINTPDFLAEEVEKMINREMFYYHMLKALYHPFAFFKKFLDVFILRPSYGISIFKKMFIRLLRLDRKSREKAGA